MTRRLAALTLLALVLAGCAKPPFARYDMETGGTVEPVMVPELVVPMAACAPGDDGIGGTGCQPN